MSLQIYILFADNSPYASDNKHLIIETTVQLVLIAN